jgi:hypothetical protein
MPAMPKVCLVEGFGFEDVNHHMRDSVSSETKKLRNKLVPSIYAISIYKSPVSIL